VQPLVGIGDFVQERPVPVVDFGRRGGGVLVEFVGPGQVNQQPLVNGNDEGQNC
jgi:hypothetical protein